MRNIFLFLASCSAAVVAGAAELPFRLAAPGESSSLGGSSVIATPLDQTPFYTAATVTVKKITGPAVSDTKRASQATAKVYKEALEAGESPGAQAVPPTLDPSEILYYEHNLNSAQAWATMNATGAPFVMIYADGKSQGKAAASWRTRYTVQGTGNRDVYARFTIPTVRFGGRWEDAAPSLTQGRMRIDFLVNGYPAWFTEAHRWNEQNATDYDTVRVDTFGNSIGLEDNSLGSNNHILTSLSRTVTVKLGTYAANQHLDLTMLYQVEGKGASECQPSGGEMDCGNISMRVDWDPSAPQPTFYSKPETSFTGTP